MVVESAWAFDKGITFVNGQPDFWKVTDYTVHL